MHMIKHFKTITYHKWLVMKGCFAVGLYKQGILDKAMESKEKYCEIVYGCDCNEEYTQMSLF